MKKMKTTKKLDFRLLFIYIWFKFKNGIAMKAKKILMILVVALFFSGCVVYSFYPLYTEKDLFPNDILTGKWIDDDSTLWVFEHATLQGEKTPNNIDSTSYILKFEEPKTKKTDDNEFSVHIIKLDDYYFLDFYLKDYGKNGLNLVDFHLVPVHTFAKLTIENDRLKINWFDQDWLKKLIESNKIRIRHEDNGDYILLTAKPGELQKFVTKYVDSEEAFEDGLDVTLIRK